jgi:alpha-L-rhamnosidase
VLALFNYFRPFRNSDGLLEKLENWVFVEWSEANKLVQDVNYPTNMLYAEALSAAAEMYRLPELETEAERIRETIRKQSLSGEFFSDNALRENGALRVTGKRTEACQYYAFYFQCATPDRQGELWNTLVTRFGPRRDVKTVFPDVYPANSFIGNYLRIELLSRYARCRQIRDEIADFFVYMADRTGTLWENTHALASCNHGFASHVAHCLLRDMLGIYRVDGPGKAANLRFTDCGLDWCEGSIPVDGGNIAVSWRKEGNRIVYRADIPEGWRITLENPEGLALERK